MLHHEMAKNNRLPNFLIVGAGKSGTTSLDNYLKQHPKLFLSPVKEPNFFAYEKIDLNTLDKDAVQHYHDSVTDINSYYELFSTSNEEQLLGETSNTYLVVEGAVDSIKSHIPEVKVIAILRQPTERLYSRYLHLAREDRLPTKNFEDVLDKSSLWWVRNDLVKEGWYYKNLSRFFDQFPKDQIKVYLTEDLKSDPQKVLSDIFEFLNVEDFDKIDFSVNFNKSGFIKNKAYDNVLGHNSMIKKGLKSLIPKKLYSKIKEIMWLQKGVNNLRDYNLSQPKLDKELKKKVTNDIYKEDILKLEKLIGRDLSHWL